MRQFQERDFGLNRVPEEEGIEEEIDQILSLMPAFTHSGLDREAEVIYFVQLKKDYPQLDILETLKDFLSWVLDNPDKYNKENPGFYRRFRKWCERASRAKIGRARIIP